MKSRNILILALIMALITTFLFNRYLKDIEEKYKKDENKVSVVVLKDDIKKNIKVTRDMFYIKDLSFDSVHPQAVKKIENIEGKYTLIDLKKDEILLIDRFTDQFQESKFLSRKIQKGFRAVSIEVNFVESVSNLIEPEEYVDIIFSEEIKENGVKTTINTQILLENIRVLAVGKRLNEKGSENKNPKDTNQKQDEVEYVSVTLEVKPSDAVKLINADERGRINLILKSKLFH